MKILMYGWEYPPYISGGLGIACHGIVTSLAKHDLKISLVLPGRDKKIASEKNIEILECDLFKEFLLTDDGPNSCNRLQTPHASLNAYNTHQKYFRNFKNIESLQEIIQNILPEETIQPTGKYGNNLLLEVINYAKISSKLAGKVSHDIIHAHDWLTILAGVQAREISKKPFVLHVHSLEFDRNGEHYNSLIYEIEKYGLQQADKIIAVSYYTKKIIQNRYGINANKIEVVHNGIFDQFVEPNTVSRKLQGKIVLFMGRITHQKGPLYFILAANKVLNYRKDVKFVIAGDGDQTKEMIECVAWFGQGKNILFTGFLGQDKVKYLYSISDLYVMPSTSEPFGITCLEALSYHVPIIISKQSGVSEVIKHAIKVDFWDVDQIAEKMLALLRYPALIKEQLNHTQEEMKKLRWEHSANKLIHVYESLMR